MSVRATAWDITSDDHTVGVTAGHDYIVVRWCCGDTRTFGPELLSEQLAHMALLAPFDDVWFADEDSLHHPFLTRIVGGYLYADDAARDVDEDDGSFRVRWKSLSKVLDRAIDSLLDDDE